LAKDIENDAVGLQGICPHVLDRDPPGDCARDKNKGSSRPISLDQIASGAIYLAALNLDAAPRRVGLDLDSERGEYMARHLEIGNTCCLSETQARFALGQWKRKHQSAYVL